MKVLLILLFLVVPIHRFRVSYFARWVLKSNESVIQILRQNRRYFFNDDEIKHYIRDSDVWQSFKRCTISGLLQMAGKCDASVDKSEMTPTLSRAVDYGDAKR